jgi:hypothetical protein
MILLKKVKHLRLQFHGFWKDAGRISYPNVSPKARTTCAFTTSGAGSGNKNSANLVTG